MEGQNKNPSFFPPDRMNAALRRCTTSVAVVTIVRDNCHDIPCQLTRTIVTIATHPEQAVFSGWLARQGLTKRPWATHSLAASIPIGGNGRQCLPRPPRAQHELGIGRQEMAAGRPQRTTLWPARRQTPSARYSPLAQLRCISYCSVSSATTFGPRTRSLGERPLLTSMLMPSLSPVVTCRRW